MGQNLIREQRIFTVAVYGSSIGGEGSRTWRTHRFTCFFFFKQKTAYEMCGRDWSSDVCSSDLDCIAMMMTVCYVTVGVMSAVMVS